MINEKASLVQIPSGYKSGTLYSVVPNTSAGDFTVTRGSTATRVNKDGLIESVAANVPRLNYDPSNPQDPHLLLEPQRINIYTYSQDLNQGNSLTNTTIDADSIVSPDGSLTGNKLTQTSGALVRKTLTILSGTYSWSFFAKKGDLRYLNARSLFVLNGTTPANGNTIIDLDTNTIAYKGTNVTSASIQQYPNDWIKVEIVATDNATGSGDFVDFFFTDSDTSTQSTGVAGNGFIWGVQFEAGSYPTSYIPTTIAVTRTVDDWENTDGLSLSGDFTYFVHIKNFDDKTLGNYPIQFFFRQSASPFSYFRFLLESNERWFAQLRDNNASVTRFNASSDTLSNLGDNIKLAFAKSGTSCKYYVNGTLVLSSTITDFNYTFNRINHTTGNNQPAKLSQVMVFDTGLTDAELQTLTT